MADKFRMIRLGMPPELAQEVAGQIDGGGGGEGQALTVAVRAEGKADTALVEVGEAQADADAALASASAANTAAGTALTTANTAQGTADGAATTADNALVSATPVIGYAAALALSGVAFLQRISATINGQLIEWVRDGSGIALGGGWSPAGDITAHHFGPLTEGQDASTLINAAIAWASQIGGSAVRLLPGMYRCNAPVLLRANVVLQGARGGSILQQNGLTLISQNGPNLINSGVRDMTLAFVAGAPVVAGQPVPRNCAFRLRDHSYCIFQNIELTGYRDHTVFERWLDATCTANAVGNTYRNIRVNGGCTNFDISCGYEQFYSRFDGNGSTSVFLSDLVWPEQSKAAVLVLRESATRRFSELTNYTLAFIDGRPQITLAAALAANETLHVWTAQTRSDGLRVISNNYWDNPWISHVYSAGWMYVRHNDAETIKDAYVRLAAPTALVVHTNPAINRCTQGGDFLRVRGGVFTYWQTLVGDRTGIRGFDFGPGSYSMTGEGVSMDLDWLVAGTNRSIFVRDGWRVPLTGTISMVNGSATVTGTGTKFTEELTLVGNVKDQIFVDGVTFGIASIESDTSLTLAQATGLTRTDFSAVRQTVDAHVDYDFAFANTGRGFITNTNVRQAGRYRLNSLTESGGTATIPTGGTTVTVNHMLGRTPLSYEIMAAPVLSTYGGRSIAFQSATSSTITFVMSSAHTDPVVIGWSARLGVLNA